MSVFHENYYDYAGIKIEIPEDFAELVKGEDENSQNLYEAHILYMITHGFNNAEIYVVLDGFFNITSPIIYKDEVRKILKADNFENNKEKAEQDWLKLTLDLFSASDLEVEGENVYESGELVKDFEHRDYGDLKEPTYYKGEISFGNGDKFQVPFEIVAQVEIDINCRRDFIEFLKYLGQQKRSNAEVYITLDGASKDIMFTEWKLLEKTLPEVEQSCLELTKLKADGNNVLEDGKVVISFKDQTAKVLVGLGYYD